MFFHAVGFLCCNSCINILNTIVTNLLDIRMKLWCNIIFTSVLYMYEIIESHKSSAFKPKSWEQICLYLVIFQERRSEWASHTKLSGWCFDLDSSQYQLQDIPQEPWSIGQPSWFSTQCFCQISIWYLLTMPALAHKYLELVFIDRLITLSFWKYIDESRRYHLQVFYWTNNWTHLSLSSIMVLLEGFLRGYNVHLPLMPDSISKSYIRAYYNNVP